MAQRTASGIRPRSRAAAAGDSVGQRVQPPAPKGPLWKHVEYNSHKFGAGAHGPAHVAADGGDALPQQHRGQRRRPAVRCDEEVTEGQRSTGGTAVTTRIEAVSDSMEVRRNLH